MASNHRQGGSAGGSGSGARHGAPEWADGLKQLYDSVVEEALPDSFKDLIDRLDAIPPSRGKASGRGSSPGGRDCGR